MIGAEDQDVTLVTLSRGEKGEIRLTRSRYEGRVFTKLQLWYPAGGEMKPGRQVITIRDHELRDVIAALSKVAAHVGSDSGGRDQQRRSDHGARDDAEPAYR